MFIIIIIFVYTDVLSIVAMVYTSPFALPIRARGMVVGCGVCGEVAYAAVLCPSFYKAEIVHNPSLLDRALSGVRRTVIGMLQGGRRAPATPAPAE